MKESTTIIEASTSAPCQRRPAARRRDHCPTARRSTSDSRWRTAPGPYRPPSDAHHRRDHAHEPQPASTRCRNSSSPPAAPASSTRCPRSRRPASARSRACRCRSASCSNRVLRNCDGKKVTEEHVQPARQLGAERRAHRRDPVRRRARRAAGLHRRAAARRPRRDAQRRQRHGQEPEGDRAAGAGRPGRRPLGDDRPLRHARTRSTST